jgi:ketosteroid isomerase-like protein
MPHTPSAAADEAAIVALETRRCELISDGDLAGLGELLTDDYVHVHAIGRADGKDAALKAFERSPRRCSRGEMNVRTYGDVAVVTGPQFNVVVRDNEPPEAFVMIVTTVVRRLADGWRIASFHACRQS